MKLVRVAWLIALACSVLPAGCSSTAGRSSESRASRQSVRNESGSLRFPYELSQAARQFSASLSLRASSGSFGYSLVDPHGTPVWQGRVGAGQAFSQSRDLKPLPGKWVLTLTMESVTGSYDVAWKSR